MGGRFLNRSSRSRLTSPPEKRDLHMLGARRRGISTRSETRPMVMPQSVWSGRGACSEGRRRQGPAGRSIYVMTKHEEEGGLLQIARDWAGSQTSTLDPGREEKMPLSLAVMSGIDTNGRRFPPTTRDKPSSHFDRQRAASFRPGVDLKGSCALEHRRTLSLAERRRRIRPPGAGAMKSGPWEEMPQLTIAAIEGFNIGGGVALTLACDWAGPWRRGPTCCSPRRRSGISPGLPGGCRAS